MAAIRARHGLRQVIGHAALLEEEQDNGDGHGIHQLGRTQTAPGQVRIHRQAGKGAAKIGDLTGCCDGAQQLQLALSCGGRRGGERIGQRQVSASRGTPHRAVQQGASEIGGGDFRCGKRGELWVLLGGDATKDGAGALAAGATGALRGGGLGGKFGDQHVHAAGGIAAVDAREAGIDHDAHAGDGERGLGDVGGDDDAAGGGVGVGVGGAGVGVGGVGGGGAADDGGLLVGAELAVQGDGRDARALRDEVRDQFGAADRGDESEEVGGVRVGGGGVGIGAGVGGGEGLHNRRRHDVLNRPRLPRPSPALPRGDGGGRGGVMNIKGMDGGLNRHDRGGEHVGERGGIHGCGHGYDQQILPELAELGEHGKREVSIEGALVDFVEDDGRHARQVGIVEQAPEQHACGDELDARVAGHGRFAAHRVPGDRSLR